MATTRHFIAWWNLENLFDVQNAPDRIPWLQRELNNYLKGWTSEVLDQKLTNLSSIIRQLNGGKGPDLMGFCEIENRHVIELLVAKLNGLGRDYDIAHREMNDQRGIDIAFIYDNAHFELGPDPVFSLEIMKRTGTRDLLQVTFKTKGKNNELIIIGNHWPSRSAGQYESEPFRMMVGENLSYWLRRIAEIKGETTPILVMGDFNDEPFNRSLTEYAMSLDNSVKISNARKPTADSRITVRIPYMLNLMWELLGKGKSTFVFNGDGNILDQFLVNRAIALKSAEKHFTVETVDIVDYIPGLIKGEYKAPVKFGAPSKTSEFNAAGYSDHLPITITLMEE
ncbi:MAG TPA: endonuclease/exonuclease/phosphatase family protein [Chitinophagaceae bacterium]|nr:endonuclease/exonuclease/phosphatase family protein [Chitinophagaceae bacterium]